ncbi:MAG: HAD family phosphatase [Epsilonproteobacteria bacterium]|nr:HAD family phosphatase [Campylobacterota bacterium]
MIYIKKRVKAIIFDMDGTIIKTEDIWQNAVTDVLAEYDIHFNDPDDAVFLREMSGISLQTAVERIKAKFNLPVSGQELAQKKVNLVNERFDQYIEFVNGFKAFHKTLQTHQMPSAIATNSPPENLKRLVDKLRLDKFFGKNIYSVADVGFRPKPDPALFLHAADRLGALPEDCVVFEDSLAGFTAAKEAGIKCIAIKSAYNERHREHVHHAIDDYDQALDALRKIVSGKD